MRYLIDTHVLLWWLNNNSPLKPAVRARIDDPDQEIIISAATVWEMGIKKALGQLKAPEDLLKILEQNDMTVLPVTAEHACAVRDLPRLHGDPFDRMLVVQAMVEGLTIITHDKQLAAYTVSCMMV